MRVGRAAPRDVVEARIFVEVPHREEVSQVEAFALHLRVDEEFVRPPERAPSVGDPSKARERLGWQTETTFEELIASMVEADLRRLG